MMTCYSVTCALFIAIYIYDTVYTPFVVPMAEQWETIKLTIFYFYIYTPVHAVMFFMGTSTVYIIRDYKEVLLIITKYYPSMRHSRYRSPTLIRSQPTPLYN